MELYIYDEEAKKVIYIIRGEEAAVEAQARDFYEQQGLLNCQQSDAFGLDVSGVEVINL